MLAVVSSLIILTAAGRDVPVIGAVRSVAVDVLSPVGRTLATVFGPVGRMWDGITGYGDLQDENRELRSENDRLRREVAESAGATQRIEELEGLLELDFADELDTVPAQVTATGVSNLDRFTVQIDKGERDGVRDGMAVVTAAGLVGRVSDATASKAFVRLIADPSMRVAVRLDTSRDLGVGRGTGLEGPFVVDEGLESGQNVAVGEPVSTSGLDRALFPAGIPIGTVSEVRDDGGAAPILEVELLVDMTQLDVVQVLRWLPSD